MRANSTYKYLFLCAYMSPVLSTTMPALTSKAPKRGYLVRFWGGTEGAGLARDGATVVYIEHGWLRSATDASGLVRPAVRS